jgi:hypothetical protein
MSKIMHNLNRGNKKPFVFYFCIKKLIKASQTTQSRPLALGGFSHNLVTLLLFILYIFF